MAPQGAGAAGGGAKVAAERKNSGVVSWAGSMPPLSGPSLGHTLMTVWLPFLSLTYLLWAIPFRICFMPQYSPLHSPVWGVLDYLSDALFLREAWLASKGHRVRPVSADFDLFASLDARKNRGVSKLRQTMLSKANGISRRFVAQEGRMRSMRMRIPWVAIRGSPFVRFLEGGMINVPIDLIAALLGARLGIIRLFLLPRLLRAVELPWRLQTMIQFLEDRSVMRSIGLQRMWKLFFAMWMAGHWAGCGFYIIARNTARAGHGWRCGGESDDGPRECTTWPEADGLFAFDASGELVLKRGMLYLYQRSVYWAYITMVTTGFGDIYPRTIPETLWCSLAMYVGVVITTASIANLTLLFSNMDAARTEFDLKMDALQKYMRYRELPASLSHRIVSFYEYQWQLLQGINETDFIAELPKTLQQQVKHFMTHDLLRALPPLQGVNNAIINALAERLSSNVYSPNDDVIHTGEYMGGVLLVARGELEVRNGLELITRLSRTDHYGVKSLFAPTRSQHAVVAKTYCEVFLLSTAMFRRVCSEQCTPTQIEAMGKRCKQGTRSEQQETRESSRRLALQSLKGVSKWGAPDSNVRRCWEGLTLLGLLWYAFSIPLALATVMQKDLTFYDNAGRYACGYIVDAMFVVDTYLQRRHFFLKKEGVLIVEPARIREEWLRSHSRVIEAFCMAPWELLGLWSPVGAKALPWGHAAKLPRLLAHVFPKMELVEHHIGEVYKDASVFGRRVVKLYLLLILACHWIGCLWLLCGRISRFLDYPDNWIETDEAPYNSLRINHLALGGTCGYLRSVYWAIVGMSTVGYGDIVPTNQLETLFASCVILFGGLLLPAIVGGLAALMSNLNLAVTQYRKRMVTQRRLMVRQGLPSALRFAILRYHNYLWSRQGGIDELKILDELPGPLRQRVALNIVGDSVSHIPFIKHMPEELQHAIVSKLKPCVFLPGDVVLNANERSTSLYLIEHGRAYVTSPDAAVVLEWKGEGDYFGEACLVKGAIATTRVVARTYLDCFELAKGDLKSTLNKDHGERTRLERMVQKEFEMKAKIHARITANIANCPNLRRRISGAKRRSGTPDLPGVGGGSPSHGEGSETTGGSFCSPTNSFDSSVFKGANSDTNLSKLKNNSDRGRHGKSPNDAENHLAPLASSIRPRRASMMPKPLARAQSTQRFPLIGQMSSATLGANSEGRVSKGTLFRPFREQLNDHESFLRQLWGTVILITILYHAVIIPVRVAWLPPWPGLSYYYFDWFTDLVFLLDAVLAAAFIPFIADGNLITDRAKIFERYRKQRLTLDLTSCAPWDVFSMLAAPTWESRFLANSRVPKLFRMLRLFPMLHALSPTFEAAHNALGLTAVTMMKLLIGVVLVTHWAACIFYMLARYRVSDGVTVCSALNGGKNETDLVWIGDPPNHVGECADPETDPCVAADTDCLFHNTWIEMQYKQGYLGYDTWIGPDAQTDQYIRALNWALPTLVVVVIGDVVPVNCDETLYVFLAILFGMSVNAVIIGAIASVVANLENEAADFIQRDDALKAYLHHHHMPKELYDRVNDFMTYLWSAHAGVPDELALLGSLPALLQVSVSEHTQQVTALKNCPFFDFCSDEIVRQLALSLRPVLYSLGDIIVQCGDMGHEMYFLKKGSVDIVSPDGQMVFATLGQGAFFGEAALFFKQKRGATVRSTTFTEVLCLTKSDLDRELRKHEFDLERMIQIFQGLKDSNNFRNSATSKNLASVKNVFGGDSKLKRIVAEDPLGAVKPPSWIGRTFKPESLARTTWDAVSTVFVLYFAIMVPFRIAFVFGERLQTEIYVMTIDFMIDLFFMVDVYLRFNEFPYIESRVLVYDRKSIRERYLSTWMYVDVASSIPLEIPIAIALRQHSIMPLLFARVTHLGRLARLPEYFSDINRHLNLIGIRVSASINLLITSFLYYVLVNHLYGCIWFMIHRYIERDHDSTWAVMDDLATFDGKQHDICSVGITACYVRSVYMVITTISSIGYGDIRPNTPLETIWQMIVVVSGACLFATLIGAFTAYLQTVDTSGLNAFKMKLQAISEYMHHRNFPEKLIDAVLLHHKHCWYRSHCLDESRVTADLPTPLRMEIAFAVHRRAVQRMPILASEPEILQMRFALAFKSQFCIQGTLIYEAGDIGWEVYFINSGQIRLSLPQDLSVLDAAGRAKRRIEQRLNVARAVGPDGSGRGSAKMHEEEPALGVERGSGAHFGTQCLRSLSGVREETAAAIQVTELYFMSKSTLDTTLAAYPIDKQRAFIDSLMEDVVRGISFKRVGARSHSETKDSKPGVNSPPMSPVTPGAENRRVASFDGDNVDSGVTPEIKSAFSKLEKTMNEPSAEDEDPSVAPLSPSPLSPSPLSASQPKNPRQRTKSLAVHRVPDGENVLQIDRHSSDNIGRASQDSLPSVDDGDEEAKPLAQVKFFPNENEREQGATDATVAAERRPRNSLSDMLGIRSMTMSGRIFATTVADANASETADDTPTNDLYERRQTYPDSRELDRGNSLPDMSSSAGELETANRPVEHSRLAAASAPPGQLGVESGGHTDIRGELFEMPAAAVPPSPNTLSGIHQRHMQIDEEDHDLYELNQSDSMGDADADIDWSTRPERLHLLDVWWASGRPPRRSSRDVQIPGGLRRTDSDSDNEASLDRSGPPAPPRI